MSGAVVSHFSELLSASDAPGGERQPRASADNKLQRFLTLTRGTRTDTLYTGIYGIPANFDIPGCAVSMSSEPVFAPSLSVHASQQHVAFTDGSAYRIDVRNLGDAVISVRRPIPATPATVELAAVEIGEFRLRYRGGECRASGASIAERQGVAPTVPLIRDLRVAPDGGLWVRRFAVRGDAALLDRFAPDGRYLGTLPPGTLLPAAFFRDGGWVAIEEDENDVPRLVLFDPLPPR